MRNGTAPQAIARKDVRVMKTTKILAVAALSLAGLSSSGSASAGVTDGLGIWEGSGTARAVGGGELGGFTVSLTRKVAGRAKVRAEGKMTLGNGQVLTFWQELEETGSGAYRIVSSNGSGEGRCLANGVCQSYEQRADRRAFATTIVLDAPNRVRVLITEFDKGQAIRFTEQSLTKMR